LKMRHAASNVDTYWQSKYFLISSILTTFPPVALSLWREISTVAWSCPLYTYLNRYLTAPVLLQTSTLMCASYLVDN
jgi:hypothetical protein